MHWICLIHVKYLCGSMRLHLTNPWPSYLDLFMNPVWIQKQCWPLTSTLGLSRWLRASSGCRVWRKEAARGACAGCEGPRGFRMGIRMSTWSGGWLTKHQSGFLIILHIFCALSTSDLLIGFDPLYGPGEAAFGSGEERCSGAFWIWTGWDGWREPPCGIFAFFPEGSFSCAAGSRKPFHVT